MKNKLKTTALIAAIMLISFSFREETMLERKDTMIKAWERAKAYTKEYLDAATQEVYDFKPTPEMRSFAEQMQHLAVDNYKIVKEATAGVTTISNYKDIEKTPLKGKAEITDAVMESYDFAIVTIKNLDEAKWNISVKMFNRWETTVEDGLAKAFEHQTHHRGQTTVYLRLKGIKPPSEKLF
ncbi:MAG TPA: damage-inducible protein DinB [Cytophagales bacterium]|nr:damage-inducible protein DinB [Cytophagales bacterium]